MVDSARSIWVALREAIMAGQRPNSKMVKLYLFGAILAVLTVFLAVIEMVHSTWQPADKDEDLETMNSLFVKPSRSTQSYPLIEKNSPRRLHAS